MVYNFKSAIKPAIMAPCNNKTTTAAAAPVCYTRCSPPNPGVEPVISPEPVGPMAVPLPTHSRSCMHAEVSTMSAMTSTPPTEETTQSLAPSHAALVPGVQATF